MQTVHQHEGAVHAKALTILRLHLLEGSHIANAHRLGQLEVGFERTTTEGGALGCLTHQQLDHSRPLDHLQTETVGTTLWRLADGLREVSTGLVIAQLSGRDAPCVVEETSILATGQLAVINVGVLHKAMRLIVEIVVKVVAQQKSHQRTAKTLLAAKCGRLQGSQQIWSNGLQSTHEFVSTGIVKINTSRERGNRTTLPLRKTFHQMRGTFTGLSVEFAIYQENHSQQLKIDMNFGNVSTLD
mmetsp:Transcript_16721/g.42753  ORF Transcript_16721/g.42753 Transcript_16721/m.42753 type:complete len:243 (+) Transcript_16721:454-1182(+)